jgi:hypothetical protein
MLVCICLRVYMCLRGCMYLYMIGIVCLCIRLCMGACARVEKVKRNQNGQNEKAERAEKAEKALEHSE